MKIIISELYEEKVFVNNATSAKMKYFDPITMHFGSKLWNFGPKIMNFGSKMLQF